MRREKLGTYTQSWSEHDLTEAHVTAVDEGIRVDGPVFTNELRVRLDFLEQELGPWGADRAFTPQEDRVVVAGKTAVFTTLSITDEPVFTWGHLDQIAFLDRPMWISAHQEAYGGSITLELDDGEPSGQTFFVSKVWLQGRGIHWMEALHEDGYALNVTVAEDDSGFHVEVPHFSIVILNPIDVQVKGRIGGLVFDHPGDRRWYPLAAELEIDVARQHSVYDVLVERGWVDLQIPQPIVENFDWHQETVMGTQFYVIPLAAAETPVTLRLMEEPYAHHSFALNLTEFMAKVEADLPIEIEITDGVSVEITFLAEPIHVGALWTNGTWSQSVENVTLLTASETSISENVSAWILAMPDGLVGVIGTPEFMTIIKPGDEVQVHITRFWRNLPGCWRVDLEPCGTGIPYPYNPPTPPRFRSVTGYWWLDEAFTAGYGVGFHTHVTMAMQKQKSMWDKYTGNKNIGLGNYVDGYDLNRGATCQSHLDAFTNDINTHGERNNYNYFVLVTGHLQDCIGAAAKEGNAGKIARCPAQSGLGPICADSLVYGLDYGSYQGKSNHEHLGKQIAWGLKANWGEPNNPCQAVAGEYSVACSNNQWNQKKFWLHYNDPAMPPGATNSSKRVIDGTYEYDL